MLFASRGHRWAVAPRWLLVCACSLPAGAATVPEVLVSATRFETTDYVTPAPISVISRQAIERSGASNLAGLLGNQAGIQLQSLIGNGTLSSLSMRGFGANAVSNTLVLLDGRRLNNPDIDSPDLAAIGLDEIERIEIIEGSAGTLFGDNAVGGVINIVTRRPTGRSFSLQGRAGSYATRAGSARATWQTPGGISLKAATRIDRSDNYRRKNAHELAGVTLGLEQGGAARRTFAEYKLSAERQELAGALTGAQRAADRRQAQFPGDFTDSLTHQVRAGYHTDLNADWRMALDGSVRSVDLDGVLTGVQVAQQRELAAINPRFNGFVELSGLTTEISVGADLEWSRYHLDSAFGFQRNRQQMAAAYLQATTEVTATINVTYGARHARVLNSISDTFTFPAGGRLNDSATVFTLGGSWHPSEQVKVFVRRDGNFRFAKVDEQLDSDTGRSGLRTQTGVSWEAGVDWRAADRHLRMMAFLLQLDNEIDTHPSASQFGPFPANTNLDPTRRAGVQLRGGFSPTPELDLDAHYTLTDGRFSRGPFDARSIPGVARHQAGISAGWRPAHGWLVQPELNYLSARFGLGDYANELEKVAARTLVSLFVQHRRGPWRAGLRVNNLLDESYDLLGVRQSFPSVETTFYPAPDRHFMLTLEYTGTGNHAP